MAATILVVDAEASIRRLLQLTLARAGYDAKTARTHEEAQRICTTSGVDLVLADVGARADGHELARWVAAECPKIRVLLMAGWSVECDDCPFSPSCDLITKPFRTDRLLAAVERALAQGPEQGAN